jgi:hypothetical protein
MDERYNQWLDEVLQRLNRLMKSGSNRIDGNSFALIICSALYILFLSVAYFSYEDCFSPHSSCTPSAYHFTIV